MGVNVLGPAWLRRLSRITGHEVIHGSTGVHDRYRFTTKDHRHGVYDSRTGHWQVSEPFPAGVDCGAGLSSCWSLFPQPSPPDADGSVVPTV